MLRKATATQRAEVIEAIVGCAVDVVLLLLLLRLVVVVVVVMVVVGGGNQRGEAPEGEGVEVKVE